MKKHKRWLTILFFFLGGIGAGFTAYLVILPWGAVLSGFILFILGLIYSERKPILGWAMNLFRATRLLMQQENNLNQFVLPSMTDCELYPDRIKEPTKVPYITIRLSWDNRSFREVKIEDIRGVISVEGHHPPEACPRM